MNKIQIERNTAKIGWIGTGIMGASMAMHLADAGKMNLVLPGLKLVKDLYESLQAAGKI